MRTHKAPSRVLFSQAHPPSSRRSFQRDHSLLRADLWSHQKPIKIKYKYSIVKEIKEWETLTEEILEYINLIKTTLFIHRSMKLIRLKSRTMILERDLDRKSILNKPRETTILREAHKHQVGA